MAFAALKKKAHNLFNEASFISHINNNKEYHAALSLMDELIEDYDYNRTLIEILSMSIQNWEDSAQEFQAFNTAIREMEPGGAMLKIIMDHHHLGVSDFPELGSASLISKIIHHQRRLTLDHIYALSKRFKIDPGLFV